jgi:hypothetical protein
VEFDPLGFSDNFDVKWLREAELKHGRVSMLAVTGWLVQVIGDNGLLTYRVVLFIPRRAIKGLL